MSEYQIKELVKKKWDLDTKTLTKNDFNMIINVFNEKIDDEIRLRDCIRELETETNFLNVDLENMNKKHLESSNQNGLIELLSINKKKQTFTTEHFSMKKKENLKDIILKNNTKDKFLYSKKRIIDLFIIFESLENHENDLNLKDTKFNIDVTFKKENLNEIHKKLHIHMNEPLDSLLNRVNQFQEDRFLGM